MQFLDLPTKIRVRIYKSLLHQEKPIEPLLPKPIRKYFKALSGPTTRLNAGFNLLLVCKRINRGCCRILYQSNTFYLRSRHAEEVSRFLMAIGPCNRSKIRALSIDFECIRTQPGANLLD